MRQLFRHTVAGLEPESAAAVIAMAVRSSFLVMQMLPQWDISLEPESVAVKVVLEVRSSSLITQRLRQRAVRMEPELEVDPAKMAVSLLLMVVTLPQRALSQERELAAALMVAVVALPSPMTQ